MIHWLEVDSSDPFQECLLLLEPLPLVLVVSCVLEASADSLDRVMRPPMGSVDGEGLQHLPNGQLHRKSTARNCRWPLSRWECWVRHEMPSHAIRNSCPRLE